MCYSLIKIPQEYIFKSQNNVQTIIGLEKCI